MHGGFSRGTRDPVCPSWWFALWILDLLSHSCDPTIVGTDSLKYIPSGLNPPGSAQFSIGAFERLGDLPGAHLARSRDPELGPGPPAPEPYASPLTGKGCKGQQCMSTGYAPRVPRGFHTWPPSRAQHCDGHRAGSGCLSQE